MELLPLLHIKNGDVVTGRPDHWTPLPKPYPDGGQDAVGLARHLFVRFGGVAVVDLGTGRLEDPDHNLYQKLAKQHVALWVDAFPETLEDVLDLFVSGAQRVTVRMDRMDAGDLHEVLGMADGEVWLGYPFGDIADLERSIQRIDPVPFLDAGAAGIVLIDLGAAGRASGFDASALEVVPDKRASVYVAGGIATRAQLDRLKAAGAAGALVGTALLQDLAAFANHAKELKDVAEQVNQSEQTLADAADAAAGAVALGGAATSILPGIIPERGRPEPEDRDA